MKTRKGLDWTAKYPAIARAAGKLPDAIIDGEICALDDNGAPDFAALQAALSEGKTDALVYFAFDLLFDGDEDLRELPLTERKARLADAALATPARIARLRFVEHFETGGDAVLRSACRLSLEGIVSKQRDAPYHSGRTDTWAKSKCRAGHEVVIGGYATTNGKFRSLLVGVNRGDHFVYVGRVGTGYGAAKVKDLLPKLKALETAKSPFTGIGAPKKEPERRLAQARACRRDRVRRLDRRRPCSAGAPSRACAKTSRRRKSRPRSRPRRQRPRCRSRQPPTSSKAVPASGGKVDVMGVLISNPDKPLWPDADDGKPVTKVDLARYYEAVGSWLIEHIKGRPCSIIRAPDGIGGEQFFQRHAMPGTSNLLELVTVFGDKKPYLQIDRVEGLAAVAQIGGARAASLELRAAAAGSAGPAGVRSRSRSDVPFSTVVEAAREMRDRLEELGLVSFCKTTGGKGLHVVTPLAVAKRKQADLAGGQGLRPRCLPADGARQSRALPDQDGEEPARRPHLPRLSAQRSHGDGGGAAVAARPARRDRLDAADLDPGQSRSRSEALHHPHRARTAGKERRPGRTTATASGRWNRRSSGWRSR